VPTFSEEVAPILAKKCQYCHLEGGLGPFPLLTYGQVKAHAFDVLDEIEEGDMPPFLIENHGGCGSFQGDPSLTPEEKDIVKRWVEGGTPKGPDLPFPALSEPYHLTGATHELEMPEPYQPSAPVADDFRCFLLDASSLVGLAFDGYEFFPGEQSVVQGMSLYTFSSEEFEALAQAHEEADPQVGFDCAGGLAESLALQVLAWTPGVPAVEFPPPTGLRLRAGRSLLLRIHYNYSHHAEDFVQGAKPTPYHGGPGQPVSDQSRLVLRQTTQDIREGFVWGLSLANFSLPPGQEQTLVEGVSAVALGADSLRLWASYPRMNQRGQSLRVSARSPSGEERCLSQVDDWEMRWAQLYWYESPITLEEGSTLSLSCSYRTRGDLDPVQGGPGPEDEFCGGLFWVESGGPF
jgi:hypothetical protein